MLSNTCRFCEHGNPEGAKFCSECGGCLHLLPCPSCGAVTDVTASTCYQCQAKLPWAEAEATVPAVATAEAAKPVMRWRTPVVAGAGGVLAIVAALGYYGYRQRNIVIADQPPAAGSQLRATRQPVDAPQAIAAPVKNSPAGKAGAAPPSAAACTPAAAALGTCAPQSVPIKGAEVSAAARDVRPPAIDAGKPGAKEPERTEGCADALAALGLCAVTPIPTVTHTQRSE